MKAGEMLKLKWLRMEAINDLHCKEYDLVMDFANKYLKGETPTFTDEELATLNRVYSEVRNRTLEATGANVPSA